MDRELLKENVEKLKALREEYAVLQERLVDATAKMEIVLEEIAAGLE